MRKLIYYLLPLVFGDICNIHWIQVISVKEQNMTNKHSISNCRVILYAVEKNFWFHKWHTVYDFIKHNVDVKVTLVTDTDIYSNVRNIDMFLATYSNFTSRYNTHLVIATEQVCWIGKACDSKTIRRFKETKLGHHRFMQSQYIGERHAVLRMLEYGINTRELDDMKMIFEYITHFPSHVVLDNRQEIFGSFAMTEKYKYGEHAGWDSPRRGIRYFNDYKCVFVNDILCLINKKVKYCPLIWHYNSVLSEIFVEHVPSCKMLNNH